MDILKMLMIYMSATLALSVQAAPTPEVTPVPTAVVTPAPTVAETPEIEVITPEPTEAPTVTPAPTVSVTPQPVPTITPNVKKYRNLAQGSKGAEVRKLQERLIELGYLPEGSADGAYGRKTANAVRKFQYYNGLTQDGVAGRATQTNLFENPDVMPCPTETPAVTATPEPTQTPEPEETEVPEEDEPEKTEETEPTEPEDTPEPEKKAEKETITPPAERKTPEATAEPDKKADLPTKTLEPTAEPEKKAAGPTETPEAEAAVPAATPETEAVYIDLDAEGYEDVTASVALNERGEPLSWTALADGITVKKTPRLRRKDDRIFISLDDLADCLTDWTMTKDENGTLVLEAEGRTIAIFNEETGPSATVDGTEMEMTGDDFDFINEGCFIDSEFLAKLFGGEALWVPEEKTLMLTLPRKTGETED